MGSATIRLRDEVDEPKINELTELLAKKLNVKIREVNTTVVLRYALDRAYQLEKLLEKYPEPEGSLKATKNYLFGWKGKGTTAFQSIAPMEYDLRKRMKNSTEFLEELQAEIKTENEAEITEPQPA